MGSTLTILQTLFTLVRRRGPRSPAARIAAPLTGFLLFLFAASQEPLLSSPGEEMLEVYLAVHAALLMAVAGAFYVSEAHGILQRCRIYPLGRYTEFLFASSYSMSRPLSLTIIAVPSVSLTILYAGDSLYAVCTPLVVTFYLIGLGAWGILALRVADRRSIPPAGALLLVTSGAVVLVVIAFAAGSGSFVRFLPLVAIASDALRAFRSGAPWGAIVRLTGLAAVPLLAAGVARRAG